MKAQKYANATLADIVRVLDASERLYAVMAEFPDDPEYWGEHMDYFDTALQACPGTAAYEFKMNQSNGESS